MSLRARYLTLLSLRWCATGLIIPVSLLLPLARGLTVAEVATAMAAQGVVVLLLEIPSGVLSDGWGRRPVVLLSAVFAVAAYTTTALADSVLAFAAAWALAGVFRALDSGALESWFVDAENARGAAHEVPSGLAVAGGVISGSVAAGSLLTAGIVHVAPWSPTVSLAVPYVGALGLVLVQGVVAAVLMRDDVARPRTPWRGALSGGWTLLRGPALRGLVLVIVLVAVGVASLELLMPVRLQELSIDEGAAAATHGLVSAAAWLFAAAGAFVASRVLRRCRVLPVAVALVVVEAGGLLTMGLAAGPLLLIGGFWTAYLVHTAFGAAYNAVVHSRVDDAHRATALSMTSMAFLGTAAAAGVALGALSDATSPSAGLFVGAGSMLLAAGALTLAGRGGIVAVPHESVVERAVDAVGR